MMAERKSSSEPKEKAEGPIRILSIDSGGILGLIPLILIQRLFSSRKDFLNKVSLFAGTSTGGIIALGLAKGLHPDRLRKLYEEKGPCIFARSFWHRLCRWGPKYSNIELEAVLKERFGEDVCMKDIPRRVLVPAFDLDNEDPDLEKRHWKPKFFSNYPLDNDPYVAVWKVALCTSAAPAYFPPYQGFIDGGVIAGNPSLAAIAKVLKEYPDHRLSDIRLLSFSTYRTSQYVPQCSNLGVFRVKTIIDILLNGSERVVDYQCRELLADSYCRVRPKQQPGVKLKMDDVKKIPIISNIAEMTDLRGVGDWLEQNW